MSGRFFLSGVTPIDANGNPYPLATIEWYIVGTTTPENVFTDAGLTSSETTTTLGSDGRIPERFFSQTRMKCVFKDSSGTTVSGLSFDGIDKSKQRIKSASAPSPTYPGLEWHDTTTGNLKERNAANSGWNDRGPIDSLLNAATVTEQLAGTETTKASTPDTVAALWQRGTDIASAGTLSLPAGGGGVYNVTGTTTINGIGSAAGGRAIWLRFAGALTLTHNGTSFILPGAANITTVAGDCALFVNEAAQDATGSNWRCFAFLYADGRFPAYTNSVATQAQMETASATNLVVTPGRAHYHPGVAKCWAYVTVSGGTPTLAANYNINSITDTATGRLTITIENDFSSASWSYSCSSEAPSAGTESFTNIRNATVAAGSIEITTQNSGGVDADPASYGFQGWGDL